MLKAVVNATLVMRDHLIPSGTVLIEDGIIKELGRAKDVCVPVDAEKIDAEGLYTGPGLIDIHTHAADNKWLFEYPAETSQYMLSHGVTGVLPALYYNLTKEQYLAAADAILNAYRRGDFANFLGFYMEGPYLNPNFGCDREKNTWKGKIDRKDYAEIIEKVKEYTRVWCISPEREGIEQFVKDVCAAISYPRTGPDLPEERSRKLSTILNACSSTAHRGT